MAEPFASLAELRAYLRIPAPEEEADPPTDEDVVLTMALQAATESIIRAANRTFELMGESPEPTSRVFTAHNGRHFTYRVDIDDTFDLADDILINYSPDGGYTFDRQYTAPYRMGPHEAPARGKPYDHIVTKGWLPLYAGTVEVTAVWGWPAIPDSIKSATLLQAARLVKRRDAPFGVIGSAEMGSQIRLLAKVDPDVEVLIANYRKWWV